VVVGDVCEVLRVQQCADCAAKPKRKLFRATRRELPHRQRTALYIVAGTREVVLPVRGGAIALLVESGRPTSQWCHRVAAMSTKKARTVTLFVPANERVRWRGRWKRFRRC